MRFFSFQVVVISYSCVIILGNFKVFRAVQSEQQGSNHEQGLKAALNLLRCFQMSKWLEVCLTYIGRKNRNRPVSLHIEDIENTTLGQI